MLKHKLCLITFGLIMFGLIGCTKVSDSPAPNSADPLGEDGHPAYLRGDTLKPEDADKKEVSIGLQVLSEYRPGEDKVY
jgi:hypothetical protein